MWDLEKYADNVAIIDDAGRHITYGDISRAGAEIAQDFGRCLVVSLCGNTAGSVVGYVSFLNSGIVPIMLNAALEDGLLARLLDIYSPAYIWMPSGNISRPLFQGMKAVYSVYDYTLLETGYGRTYPLYDGLALLLTTSGSTGSPKFVRQSYANIESNTASIVEYLHLDSLERPITTLPMNYTYGLSIINTHLAVGATLLLTEKSLMQKEFWQFFKEEGATSFGGVPYTYEMLDRLRFYRMDLQSLRTMTQAGGKLTPELHAKFADYAARNGKDFVVMYGQCEATARMGYLPPDMAVEKCGSMGVAIPGGRFTLADENGARIDEPHKTGELIYEGANVTLGYAECGDDLAKGDERSGILATGDMAQFDEDGYYYIVGRKKRFLKIYGNRVNLDEIDRLIKGHFEGMDCASTGIDDHMDIFITDAGLLKPVQDFIVKTTRLNPAAFRVAAVPAIPKNDSGKVLYGELEGMG